MAAAARVAARPGHFRQWLANHRRLRTLVTEFETLTLAIADADRPARSARDTRQTAT